MRDVVALIAIACATVPVVAAQTPAFDVASIKANHSGLPNTNFGMPGGGRFTATNAPLREIIRVAFDNVPDFLIVDAPDWIRVERFDIVAKAEGSPGREQLFAMIRTLLADRFKVATHRETRELPQYTLVRVKPDVLGPRLRPAAADCAAIMAAAQKGTPPPRSDRILCGSRNRPGVIAIGGMTMDQIARGFWLQLGRVVIDRTGLQGSYDVDLDFAPDLSTPSDLPSIFTAVQEQLGLKLESTRGQVEVLVVDHVERPKDDSAADEVPRFDVATIKVNKSGDDRAYSSIQPGGRLSATNVRLFDLILSAYRFRFQPSQIVGGPDWIRSEHFNIEAKPATGSNPTEAQIPDMLRALLVERFKLATHEESREVPVYELMKVRSDGTLGPRLTLSSDGDCVDPGAPPVRGPRPPVEAKGPQPCGRIVYSPAGWTARRVTTDQIAKALEAFVGRAVVNRTELAGSFNVDLEFTRDAGGPVPPDVDRAAESRTSIFTALREQLGLRLDAQKTPVPVLVIDRAEHPSED